jgi:hypothetical protein
METQNVFILQLNSENVTSFQIIEAFNTRYGFSHADAAIIDGFKSKKDAELYCAEFNFNIVN